MERIACIAIGGALGALCRWALGSWIAQATGGSFPWGTLAINLSGCLVIGFLGAAMDRGALPSQARDLAMIGFLGAYTTFSTFGYETIKLMRDAEWSLVAFNVLGSNIGGLALAFAGFKIGQAVLK